MDKELTAFSTASPSVFAKQTLWFRRSVVDADVVDQGGHEESL